MDWLWITGTIFYLGFGGGLGLAVSKDREEEGKEAFDRFTFVSFAIAWPALLVAAITAAAITGWVKKHIK